MASLLVKIATFNNIQAGQSITRYWNYPTPANAVWHIQAIPLESSFTAQPTEQNVEVEVTSVRRKLNQTLVKKDVSEVLEHQHQIWYVIKNVGTREVDVDVYASIIY
jgi:hypothetical protein